MTTPITTCLRNAALIRIAVRPVRTRRLLARWALTEPIWADVDPTSIAKTLTSSGSWPLLASLARLTQSGDPDAAGWLAAALSTHCQPALKRSWIDDLIGAVVGDVVRSGRDRYAC
jgi:hypothetical protein